MSSRFKATPSKLAPVFCTPAALGQGMLARACLHPPPAARHPPAGPSPQHRSRPAPAGYRKSPYPHPARAQLDQMRHAVRPQQFRRVGRDGAAGQHTSDSRSRWAADSCRRTCVAAQQCGCQAHVVRHAEHLVHAPAAADRCPPRSPSAPSAPAHRQVGRGGALAFARAGAGDQQGADRACPRWRTECWCAVCDRPRTPGAFVCSQAMSWRVPPASFNRAMAPSVDSPLTRLMSSGVLTVSSRYSTRNAAPMASMRRTTAASNGIGSRARADGLHRVHCRLGHDDVVGGLASAISTCWIAGDQGRNRCCGTGPGWSPVGCVLVSSVAASSLLLVSVDVGSTCCRSPACRLAFDSTPGPTASHGCAR